MPCSSPWVFSGGMWFWNVLLVMTFTLIIWLRWCLQVISAVKYLKKGKLLWDCSSSNFQLMHLIIISSGPLASYYQIMMSYNPSLSCILTGTLSLIWPLEPLQASFSVILTRPHPLWALVFVFWHKMFQGSAGSFPVSAWNQPLLQRALIPQSGEGYFTNKTWAPGCHCSQAPSMDKATGCAYLHDIYLYVHLFKLNSHNTSNSNPTPLGSFIFSPFPCW